MRSEYHLSTVLLVLAALHTGCVSVQRGSDLSYGKAIGMEFPDQQQLVSWGTYHSVFVTLELKDAIDPFPIIPQRRGSYEVYNFDQNHRIEFHNTVLHIEDEPFPSGPDATLILFLPRHGSWDFRYRGVPITIEQDGWWKPALLRDRVYGDAIEEDLGVTRRAARRRAYSRGRQRETLKKKERFLVEEALKVGRHLIIFRPDLPYLEVNEKRVPIRDDLKIAIDARGRVTYEH